ncbi:MAG: hypothetical protein ACREXP_00965 [Steroidobacteraceae bacterium]
MSTEKPRAIPLDTLLERDPEVPLLPPGQSGIVMPLVPNRNLHVLMGEKDSDPLAAEEAARLRQAITRELWESRDKKRQRAAEAEQQSAPYRQGGAIGRVSKKTQYIRDAVREHPTFTAEQLYSKIGGREPIKTMKRKTFNNQFTKARKVLGFTV